MLAAFLRASALRVRRFLGPDIDVRALYLVMSIGLLSPLASAVVLPLAPDHANHTAFIVEARAALEEGQFPLRVAPFASDHNRYPLFQFYSQTPYVLGGIIYKYITPDNPWQALKLVDLIALFAAAWFTYRLALVIGFDRQVAVLMGACFITAPYVLINFHGRGAFTEGVAQCILPPIGYWTIQLVRRRWARDVIGVTAAWALLGTTHVITFVLATFFLGVFVALLWAFRAVSLRTAAVSAVAALPGWAVSAFQWYPAATTGPLKVASAVGGVFHSNWLTPLSALISLTGTQPEPSGGFNPLGLNPTIGVPILIATLGCVYFAWTGRLRAEAKATVATFAIAAFMTWSPIDFWSYMPAQLWIVQFTYRLLTFTVVFGCLLAGYFVAEYRARIGNLAFLPVLVVLIVFAAPFAPSMPRGPRTVASVIAEPLTSYAAGAYEFVVAEPEQRETRLPIVYGDGWLMLDRPFPITRAYLESGVIDLVLTGSNPLPATGCSLLTLRLDGAEVASTSVSSATFSWRVPVARMVQHLTGDSGHLAFTSACGIVPAAVDPKSGDQRHLWLQVSEVRFDSGHPPIEEVNVDQIRRSCHLQGAELRCVIRTTGPARVQIPQLYYPRLLTLTVNGNRVPARPSLQARSLVVVDVPGGVTRISCRFSGSRLGNTVSLVSSALVLLFAGWRFYDVRQRRRSAGARVINSPMTAG
jgi:hypothetical protein